MKASVILPVYNVEGTLERALESVCAQTLEDIEIIAVNDGSTDASPEILARAAERDERIRIVTQENAGYGAACNRGLSEAQGEWIAIVEPDDWVEPHMLQALCKAAEEFEDAAPASEERAERASQGASPAETPNRFRVDVVKAAYFEEHPTFSAFCPYKGRVKTAHQPFTIADEGADRLLRHHPAIWSAIYRREFLEENDIRFVEAPGAGWTDNPFLYDTLLRAQTIVYRDEAFYHYRIETPEHAAAFFGKTAAVPLTRFLEMDDRLRALLPVAPKGVRGGHTKRGVNYLCLAAENGGLDDEKAAELAAQVIDRLNADEVFAEPELSPTRKRIFATLAGIETPSPRRGAAASSLKAQTAQAIANVRANGLGKFIRIMRER